MWILLADVILFLGALAVMVSLTHRAMMREVQAQEALEGGLTTNEAPAQAATAAATRTSAVA